MGWKDWTRTDKVVVTGVTIVCVAAIVVFSIAMWGPKDGPPTAPPSSSASSVAPPPSPSPTYECTTATGPDCTKELAEKEAARDQAYAAAEKVIRDFHVEYDEALQEKSDISKLPADLAKLLSSEYEESTLAALQGYRNDLNFYFVGSTKLVTVAPAKSSPDWPTQRVVLSICRDSTERVALEVGTDEHQFSGSYAAGTMTLDKQKDGSWIIDSSDLKKVEGC